jgi:hypothetical protein
MKQLSNNLIKSVCKHSNKEDEKNEILCKDGTTSFLAYHPQNQNMSLRQQQTNYQVKFEATSRTD